VATAKDDQDPLGPQGPLTPSVDWLILQRLDDLRRAQDDLRADMKALDTKLQTQINKLDAKIDSLRNWSLGLLLLAILGLLAKLLIPGA